MSTKQLIKRQQYPEQLKLQIGQFVMQHVPENSKVADIDKHTVAKVFQTNPELVFRVAKQCGVELKKPVKQVSEKHEIYRRFIQNNSHMTCSEVAEQFGESYHYIKGLCKRFNLALAEGKPYNRREVEQVPEDENAFFNPSAKLNWLI